MCIGARAVPSFQLAESAESADCRPGLLYAGLRHDPQQNMRPVGTGLRNPGIRAPQPGHRPAETIQGRGVKGQQQQQQQQQRSTPLSPRHVHISSDSGAGRTAATLVQAMQQDHKVGGWLGVSGGRLLRQAPIHRPTSPSVTSVVTPHHPCRAAQHIPLPPPHTSSSSSTAHCFPLPCSSCCWPWAPWPPTTPCAP